MENNDRIKFKDFIDKIDFTKLDLSEENIKKTQYIADKNILLKDFKPTFDELELIIQHSLKLSDCTFTRANINNLSDDLKEMKIISVHDYDDTHTTSIILEDF